MKSKIENRESKIHDADWEVLPPESKASNPPVEPLFRWIALLMDNLVRVPGTQFRVGIDPLIGLIPGLGDTGAAMISALALVQAARQGVPKVVLVRMSLNILINELIGIVPVIGDAFSFWFKSNARNYELIKKHTAAPGRARTAGRSDWLFVVGVLVALGLLVSAGLLVSLFVLQQLFRIVSAG